MCKPEGHAHGSACSLRYQLQIQWHHQQNQYSTVSLTCAYSHVFDKVSVSCGITEGHKFVGFEFPQGDPSMVMPCSHSAVSLSKTQEYLKEPLPTSVVFSNFSRVRFCNPITFVDRKTGSDGLARIYMFNDDEVDTKLLFLFWLRFIGDFHDTCVLVAHSL